MQQTKVGERDDGTKNGDPGDLTLAAWLQRKCREEHLSLRAAADRTRLSHATIAAVLRGERPSVDSIDKLAIAFSGDGRLQRPALKDWMLNICGYRNYNQKGEMSEPLARLIDKLSQFSDPQLKIMERFAEFITEMGKEWFVPSR